MYKLRFDVETISKATPAVSMTIVLKLRFDVETISKATILDTLVMLKSCGLM